MDVIFQTGRFCRKQFEVVPLGMKRLFSVSLFFFGTFFFAQPQVAFAAAGDSCSGGSGTCQTITVCNASRGILSDSAECPGFVCCLGASGSSAGDSTGKTCASSIDGRAGTCQTRTNCNGGALGNADVCTNGLGCCVGGTAAASSTDCTGQSVDTVCIAITGQYGRCKAVPNQPTPLSCVVDPSYDNGETNPVAGATPCEGGVMRSGICFPTGTGLSSAPVGLLLMRLMNWLLAIFGTLAIIAFVISGIQYLVSAGNEEMIETAKRNMWYSIVGVIVALSGWIIIITIDQVLRCNFVFNIGSLSICL